MIEQPGIASRRGLVLFAASLAVAGASLAAQAAWNEARNERFVLRGPLAGRTLNDIACAIGESVRAVNSALPTGMPSIIAVGGEQGVRELLPQFWERRVSRPLGAQWSGAHGDHVLIRTDSSRLDLRRRALHEIAHVAVRRAQPAAPRWLDEGIAVLWENADVDADHVDIGKPAGHLVKQLRSGDEWRPIETLLTAAIPEGGEGSKPSAFYAQAWALTHYLVFEKKTVSLALDTLPAAFPTDDELKRYVSGPLAAPARIASTGVARCGGKLATRGLSLVESLLVRARAAADTERPSTALPFLEQVLSREPRHAEALKLLESVR